MSFGWSVGDLADLVKFAWTTVQNCRKACGEYDELTRQVESLHAILRKLKKKKAEAKSLLNRRGEACWDELRPNLQGTEEILQLLNALVSKYALINRKDKTFGRLWTRAKFGNKEVNSLNDLRQKARFYTEAISAVLNATSLASLGRIENLLGEAGLADLKPAIKELVDKLSASHPDQGSVLTRYSNDDTAAWKELRRELIKDKGIPGDLISKNKELIKQFIYELGDSGYLNTDTGEEDSVRNISSSKTFPGKNVSPGTRSRDEAQVADHQPPLLAEEARSYGASHDKANDGSAKYFESVRRDSKTQPDRPSTRSRIHLESQEDTKTHDSIGPDGPSAARRVSNTKSAASGASTTTKNPEDVMQKPKLRRSETMPIKACPQITRCETFGYRDVNFFRGPAAKEARSRGVVNNLSLDYSRAVGLVFDSDADSHDSSSTTSVTVARGDPSMTRPFSRYLAELSRRNYTLQTMRLVIKDLWSMMPGWYRDDVLEERHKRHMTWKDLPDRYHRLYFIAAAWGIFIFVGSLNLSCCTESIRNFYTCIGDSLDIIRRFLQSSQAGDVHSSQEMLSELHQLARKLNKERDTILSGLRKTVHDCFNAFKEDSDWSDWPFETLLLHAVTPQNDVEKLCDEFFQFVIAWRDYIKVKCFRHFTDGIANVFALCAKFSLFVHSQRGLSQTTQLELESWLEKQWLFGTAVADDSDLCSSSSSLQEELGCKRSLSVDPGMSQVLGDLESRLEILSQEIHDFIDAKHIDAGYRQRRYVEFEENILKDILFTLDGLDLQNNDKLRQLKRDMTLRAQNLLTLLDSACGR